ncbi:hypothetical protein BCR44DRAFT_43286 [Catenaria anguillulae PL171]|uniref:Uncharacterized protein n=1 Tax=Catenaria anguillulae PL171 TaxID=765915 RepID=A0A1Y2I3A3_9FUNG|nr:hypothetical protein BCR44DRAFT_43286 [Catenaria anguillulae PL171]
MARDSNLYQSAADSVDSDAASDAEQREVRLINAQNSVLTTIGVMAAGIGAQTDPPRRSHDLALGLGFISIQSILTWPLDAWRLHMSVWQSPSWFAIAFRSVPANAAVSVAPSGRFPSAARPAMVASFLESTLWPATLIALHLNANAPSSSSASFSTSSASRSRRRHRSTSSNDTQTAILSTLARTFAPDASTTPSSSSSRPRQPHIPPLARFFGPRIARYLAYPFRHTSMLRHLGHPGPSLTPASYATMILAPFTSYQLGSGPDPHPDLIWWAAHELIDSAEQLLVTATRMAMVKSREQRPKASQPHAPVVPPPPGLALLLLEAWVPPLIAKMAVHAPRVAVWRAQLGLEVLPWRRLVAGIEPFVLAEIIVDWYLIEMSARAMDSIKDWLRPPVTRGSSRSARARRLIGAGAGGERSASGSRSGSWVYPSSP